MISNRRYDDPIICMLLLIIMIFEVPVFNIYLIAPIIMLLYYVVIMKDGLLVGVDDAFLAAFIISYFAIDSVLEYSTSFKVIYAASMICSYLCGKKIIFMPEDTEYNSLKIERVIKLIAYTYLAYVVITMLYSIYNGQFLITRNPLSIWTGEFRAATHFGTMLVIPAAYGIYLLILASRKFCGGCILIVCIAVSVMTASRTILYLIPVGIGVCILANAKYEGGLSRRLFTTVVGLVIAVIFFIAMFYANAFGIYDMFLNTQLGQRIMMGQASSIKEDGRMTYISFLFSHLEESFLGGGYTRLHSGRLHNLFLNVYDIGGIIPFSFLCAFSVKVTRKLNGVLKGTVLDANTKTLLLLLYTLVFVQMMLEPVMESVPVFVWCFLYIAGAVHEVAWQ